jgi:translocator protein
MSHTRPWLVTVPAILAAGLASGWLSNSGYGNIWFASLRKPALMPPAWVFPVAWTVLYILMGIALGRVIAQSNMRRRRAIMLFVIQLALNLSWSPIFFGLHEALPALIILITLVIAAGAATIAFWKVQTAAGALMLPYLAWLIFATYLNGAIVHLNG